MTEVLVRTDHLLWFFSTCAQTFAALVGVFGMFILYRLQVEEGRIGALRERMIGFHKDHQKLPFESILRELKRIEEDHRSREELEHAENIKTLVNNYGGAIAKRAWLAHVARRPIVVLVFLILWSLFLLAAFPHYRGFQTFAEALLWSTFLISAFPVYEVGRIIFVSIRTD